jgi:hypothetical protein
MPVHVLPLSVVRTTDVQGWAGHGAVPSTQPCVNDTNVTDAGTNPAGTGPPRGEIDGPRVVVVDC